jgi:hypothetical protein
MSASEKRDEGRGDKGTRVIGPGAKAKGRAPPNETEDTELRRWARMRGATPQVSLIAAPGGLPGIGPTRYAPESLIGKGGVGEVDLVVDRDLGRHVARKRLRPELQGEALLVQAFLEEAMITGALEHPAIVPVHDIGVSPSEGPWYTMKRLEGEALSAILSRLRSGDAATQKRWPLPRLVDIFVQVLRAMTYAHARRVIHCDLKPSNVLVGPYGEVVVVDWGLAKVLGERGRHQARAQLWSGSNGYMPPEQATSGDTERLGEATDIWALGAMLYEIVALVVPQATADGGPPEARDDGGFEPIVPLRERRREVPAGLEQVVTRALALTPEDRTPSVRAMLEDVESWLAGTRERERREERIAAITEEVDTVLTAIEGAESIEPLARAARSLTDALRDQPERQELVTRAAALYWRVFRAMHRDRLPRDGATALLDELAGVVVPGPEAGADIGPWLEALEQVADAPRVRALLDKVRALHAAPPFSDLDGHGLVPVASAAVARTIEAGESLFSEGEAADALWIVCRGEVEVCAGGKRLNVLTGPICLGEIGLVERSTRTASVIARTRVEALTLGADRFDALVRRHGSIAMGVMKLLAHRLREATLRETRAG